MAKTKQQITKYLAIGIVLLISVKCANQMSPPGGDVDEIPPTIISTYPENGTTNFKETEIELSFSEYVNKRNINEAFFISPLIEGVPEFSWTNKTVYIEFPDTLQSNTTYSVIIGTEITDYNNNNKMSQPFTLTFSTGSKIDSGKIGGNVYASKAEGTLIFAYKLDSGMVDIYNEKPNYLSQIDEKGHFELSGLADGKYLLFAVKDEFKDLVYNVGDDLIGIPSGVIEISPTNRKLGGQEFIMQKEDTLAPNIQEVTMTDKYHIVVEFDEAIDSSKMGTDNYAIHDSTENKIFKLKYLFKTNPKKNQYILALTDSLNEEYENFLIVNDIADVKGNVLEKISFSFTPSSKLDTNLVSLGKIDAPYDKGKIDYINSNFVLNFNDGFDTSVAKDAISMLSQDSINLPLIFDAINDASIKTYIEEELTPNSQYTLFFEMKHFIDAAGNSFDTVIAKRVSTVNDLDFSGASGTVTSDYENIKVVLNKLNANSEDLQVALDAEKKFEFDRVVPGKYLVWAYADSDSNESYSYGNVEPFKFAEFFKYYPDTLNLRARWPIGDINIDLINK